MLCNHGVAVTPYECSGLKKPVLFKSERERLRL